METQQWSEAKQLAVRVLEHKARRQDTISYSQFVRRLRAVIPDLDYYGDNRFNDLLDEISIDQDAAGRGLISVLVVTAGVPHRPSDGFYALAAGRHPDGTSQAVIFERERDAVFAAHSSA